MIWGFIINASTNTAVHLGNILKRICVLRRKMSVIRLLLYVTQKLILDHEDEILRVSTIEWDHTPRTGSTLIRELVVKLSTAKFYVFSDSGPCLGDRIAEYLICTRFFCNLGSTELNESENLISIVSWRILTENQSCSSGRYSQDTLRWSMMTMYNDIDWDESDDADYARKVHPRIWLILRTWLWRKMICYTSSKTRQFVERSRWTNDTYICRKRTSCFQRKKCFIPRTSNKQKKRRRSIHVNAERTTAELMLRIVVSVDQLTDYWVMTDWCHDLAQ